MDPDDVSDITRRLRAAEQDPAAARVLAGAAAGVGEIRAEIIDFRQATAASVNALRQDFVDLRQEFTGQQRIVELIETLIDHQHR